MKLNHPQLKQYVIQNLLGQLEHVAAFNEGHARLTAEMNGQTVVRVMTLKEFERVEEGFKMGVFTGFQEGYKAAMTLPQQEEEEIGERITQLQPRHITRIERNIP